VRLFVAVSPGEEVVRRIEASLSSLRPAAPSAKWVGPGGIHVTLAFLGERPAEDAPKIASALDAAAAEHRPFELRFTGGGAFGRQSRPRVLWAGCEGDLDALGALHASVGRALGPLGYVPESRPFTAHLTLARSREQGGDLQLGRCVEKLQSMDFGKAVIEEVGLYESKLSPAGARYEVAHHARLGLAATPWPS
jgi:2'-5' RNA ligase